jgi:hypothetical protein
MRSHRSRSLIEVFTHKCILVTAIAVGAVFVGAAVSADFEAGLRAYEAKDYRKAFKVWQEAARAGSAKAQLRLGHLYEAGQGVPQNFVEAHRWYNLAAAEGEASAAAARDGLMKRMTPEQVAAAQRLAAEWTPSRGATATPTPSKPTIGKQTQDTAALQHRDADPGALLEAASSGDVDGVRRALSRGISPNTTDSHGRSALMLAALRGALPTVTALIDANADVNAVSAAGDSALMAAVFAGHSDVVRALLARGASAAIQNRDRDTAFEIADRRGQATASEMLHGAGINDAKAAVDYMVGVWCGPTSERWSIESERLSRSSAGGSSTQQQYEAAWHISRVVSGQLHASEIAQRSGTTVVWEPRPAGQRLIRSAAGETPLVLRRCTR